MARPETGADGSVNLMVWHCSIPGKAKVSNFCMDGLAVVKLGKLEFLQLIKECLLV